ncbi:hypothetical protein CASFOL_023451 [Castilleja foliolosa]|uniref:Uncharacterized protein n=1 Tax=Castilleja foliolosa TaxID=1961234 RepID=A0ABD3CPG3_9LAMI
MAAYASLVSVMHIIQTIHNHPRPPISFYNKQLKSLTNNITFLQQFLETHSIEDDGLESRIADAAYAAEDIIESHIADQIEPTKTLCSTSFYISLRKVIQDFALIQRDMPSFATKTGIKDDDHRRSSTCRDKTAVGLDV